MNVMKGQSPWDSGTRWAGEIGRPTIACCKVDLPSWLWHSHFALLVCSVVRFNVKILKNFLIVEFFREMLPKILLS